MRYVYPAIFTRDDEFIFVEFPDLEEAITKGLAIVERRKSDGVTLKKFWR